MHLTHDNPLHKPFRIVDSRGYVLADVKEANTDEGWIVCWARQLIQYEGVGSCLTYPAVDHKFKEIVTYKVHLYFDVVAPDGTIIASSSTKNWVPNDEVKKADE